MRIWQGICLSAVASVSMATLCHAQSTVTPEDEYKKLIRVSEDIQPLGANPFGEQVSLYNGSLSFEQTDISLAGNGPVLQLSRSFRTIETHPDNPVGGLDGDSIDGAFSDWNLEVPRISTNIGYHAINPGWEVMGSTPYARCSHFSAPPTIIGWQGNADWEPHSWWAGDQLIIPGEGSQDLLVRASSNPLAPTGGAANYPIVTTKNWMISCGVLTDDETNGGEGFMVLAPDGTKYTLNHLVYRWESTIDRPTGSGPESVGRVHSLSVGPMVAPTDYLQRQRADMLVTKIQDRFGNTLTYHYDPSNPSSLTSIVGSDGRQLMLAHDDGTQRITKATLTDAASGTARVWQYIYDPTANSFHLLKNVILPDTKQWSYNLGLLFANMTPDAPGSECDDTAQFIPKSWTGSITHPSGLTGSFTIAPLVRGRSYVPRECQTMSAGNSYAALPRVYYLPAIVSKTFSGAGVSQAWSYSYSLPNQSWSSDPCAATQSCVSTVTTDVLDPDGHDVTYTFSNRFDYTESQLLRTDYHSGNVGSGVLRSETSGYAILPIVGVGAWPWPWPSQYGYNLQSRINTAQTQEVSPQIQRTTTQSGDTYTWQGETFNAYAQLTKTKRHSSIAGQTTGVEETTTYLNDTSLWVLGLPLQVTNVATGDVESSNTYATNDALLTRSLFGQPLMSYTFYDASASVQNRGQLASFTDGNAKTTTLSSYKRGIPQLIQYPDNTRESLAVDDFGQIGSLTDQAGHTTSYAYDPVGRITDVTYPAGDEVVWKTTHFAYSFVHSNEQGVDPASTGHWRRTTTTGSYQDISYFDAMLRPVLDDSSIVGIAGSDLTSAKHYDSKGQTLFASYPQAGALTLSALTTGAHSLYDALGRPTQSQQDSELGLLTTQIAYLSGAGKQVTDPKGYVTATYYQVFDQPSDSNVIKVVAPTGITQTITRDVYGSPTAITQSGLYGTENDSVTKSLVYDIYHRLCRTREPESGDTVVAYDGANNLRYSAAGLAIPAGASACGREVVPATAMTTVTYDPMNRVQTITPPTGTQSTSYVYDALGNVAWATSGLAIWEYHYNFRSMLTSETLHMVGTPVRTLSYAHDAYGHLRAVGYPDGESVSYAPNARGRDTQVGSYLTGIGTFPDGQIAQFTYGNGTSYVADQNTRQLPGNFSYGPGSTVQLSEDLTYDKNGNITAVTDLASGPRSKALGYDALNRLTTATAAGLWGSQTYTYDAINNLRSVQIGSALSTYQYSPGNHLASISGSAIPAVTYQYDALGNTTHKNATTLTFDQKNQLTQIVGGDSYAYDASGRRVLKTPASGSPTYYMYSQSGKLMQQVSGATTTQFIYRGGQPVARKTVTSPNAPIVTYIYADPQGTALAEADGTGTINARFDYAPYGVAVTASGMSGAPNGPGYTGHVNDPESGLVYMQARYYDPAVGRFLSADPVTPSPGNLFNFNRYDYASNNPIVNVDPDGRQSSDDICMGNMQCESNEGGSSSSTRENSSSTNKGTYAPITDSERNDLGTGNLADYWEGRYDQQDPWAGDGLALWDPTNPAVSTLNSVLAKVNMFRLTNGLWERDDFEKPRDSYGMEIHAIGVQIAQAYTATVDNNGGYVPTLSQSENFHYQIFESHGLSSATYGGTPFGYSPSGIGHLWGNVQAQYLNWRFHYCSPGCVQ
ncbi:MAG: RHS repeat-associated core domain-containing protein [Rhodanobacter sp.]